MDTHIEQIKGDTPITILTPIGELDASNYRALIQTVADLYQNGTRNLLLDLSDMPFMASSGLVAFHRIALIMRGDAEIDPEGTVNPMRAIASELKSDSSHDAHCKLLNPQPRVTQTLQVTGFDKILKIFYDRDIALASFSD